MKGSGRAHRLWLCAAAASLVVAVLLIGPSAGSTQPVDPGAKPVVPKTKQVEPEVDPTDPETICGPPKRGEHCGPGNNRRTRGGGEKVSHKNWPAVSGILWIVKDSRDHQKVGGPDNDELLGHHGSDRIEGKGGRDIIWGDWDPKNNNERQRDKLYGGTGNDLIYPSHGLTKVAGGPGNDYVFAYYGRGTIDCGSGKDLIRVRLEGHPFRSRRCETVGHFCSIGPDGHGGCLKPGEKRSSKAARSRP